MLTPPDSRQPGGTLVDSRLDGRDLIALFDSCLKLEAPATIATGDMTAACQARFAERSEQLRTIEFDILAKVDEHFSGYLSYCVSFYHRRRTWLFVAKLRAFVPAGPNGLPRLVLKTPGHAVVADMRRAPRVRFSKAADFEVRLTTAEGGIRLDAEVVDVGLGGMGIDLLEGDFPELQVGARISAELRLGQDVIALRAEVRHREGKHLGLMFLDVGSGEVLEPPAPYRRIVRSLESHWFAALGK